MSNAEELFDADTALQQAVAHHQAGAWPAAEALYKSILARQPDHPDANHNLGLLAARFGHVQLAEACVRRALQQRNDTLQYWRSLAGIFQTAGKTEDARKLLTQGILQFFNNNQPVEVEALARELTIGWPENGFGWKALGTALCLQGKNASALAPLNKAVRLLPDNAEAHNSLGNACRETGKIEEAARHYRRALDLAPGYAVARTSLMALLFEAGKVAEVISQLDVERRSSALRQETSPENSFADLGSHAIATAYDCCRRILNAPDGSACANPTPVAGKKLGKYLVSKGWEGFCDRLQCLSHCITLALRHGHILQVNWDDRIWSHGTGGFFRYFALVDLPYVTSAEEIPAGLRTYPKYWRNGLELPLDDWIYRLKRKLLLHPVKAHKLDQVWIHPSVGFRRFDHNQLVRHLRLTPEAVVAVSALLESVPRNLPVVHLRGTDRKVDEEKWQALRNQIPVACVVSDDARLVERWIAESPESVVFSDTLVSNTSGGHKIDPSSLAQHGFDKYHMNIRLIADFLLIAAATEAHPLNVDSLFFKMARNFGAAGGVAAILQPLPAAQQFPTAFPGVSYSLRLTTQSP